MFILFRLIVARRQPLLFRWWSRRRGTWTPFRGESRREPRWRHALGRRTRQRPARAVAFRLQCIMHASHASCHRSITKPSPSSWPVVNHRNAPTDSVITDQDTACLRRLPVCHLATYSLFGWLVRLVAGSWKSTAGWFVWEKNIIPAENLRSFMTSHSQTNSLLLGAAGPWAPSLQPAFVCIMSISLWAD